MRDKQKRRPPKRLTQGLFDGLTDLELRVLTHRVQRETPRGKW